MDPKIQAAITAAHVSAAGRQAVRVQTAILLYVELVARTVERMEAQGLEQEVSSDDLAVIAVRMADRLVRALEQPSQQ